MSVNQKWDRFKTAAAVRLRAYFHHESKGIMRRELFGLTGPLLVEQGLIVFMSLVNTAMVSRDSEAAVAAVGMVLSVNVIIESILSAVAVGITVIVGQYAGAGDRHSGNRAAKQVLYFIFAVSLLITAVLFIFRRGVMQLCFGGASAELMDLSIQYFAVTVFTFPLMALTLTLTGIMRGVGDSMKTLIVNGVLNTFNIIFSFPLIYGLGPIPPLSVTGAAVGNLAARLVGVCVAMAMYIKGIRGISIGNPFDFKLDWSMLKRTFAVGVPAATENLLFQIGKLVLQIFVVGMGTAQAAAHSIANTLFTILNLTGTAVSYAAVAVVARAVGRRELGEAREALIFSTKVGYVFLTAVSLLILPFMGPLCAAFAKTNDVYEITLVTLRDSALFISLMWAPAFIIPSGLRGGGDTKYPLYISLVAMWTVRIGLGYLFGVTFNLGVRGIFFGMYLDWLVRSAFFIPRMLRRDWMRPLT